MGSPVFGLLMMLNWKVKSWGPTPVGLTTFAWVLKSMESIPVPWRWFRCQ